ncbi:hypothetical protein A2U01_0000779 [Trifolium medium]|uniref:Uncharacterized protein n=1 Tax=Trifolium medium TaxID=97028 RepID=A0A392LYH4_9FABA|nr:hypothetical protein [Trifolium medium]
MGLDLAAFAVFLSGFPPSGIFPFVMALTVSWRVLWHLLAPAKSASIVTTLSFALWNFILRCTVDGTASNDAKLNEALGACDRAIETLDAPASTLTKNISAILFFSLPLEGPLGVGVPPMIDDIS